MNEKRLEDVVKGVTFLFRGPFSFSDEFSMPFVREVADQFQQGGFSDAIKKPFAPPPNPNMPSKDKGGPTADGGVTLLAVGLSVFLGTTIGTWVVEKLCDELYEVKVRPALKNLIGRLTKDKKKVSFRGGINLYFQVYYETDDLHVIVHAVARTPEELQAVEALIPEAERKALAWVERNGVTAKTVLYKISNGELTNYPQLS